VLVALPGKDPDRIWKDHPTIVFFDEAAIIEVRRVVRSSAGGAAGQDRGHLEREAGRVSEHDEGREATTQMLREDNHHGS